MKREMAFTLMCGFFSMAAHAELMTYTKDDYGYSISGGSAGAVQVCKTNKGGNDRICKVIDDHQVELLSPPEYVDIRQISGCEKKLFVAMKNISVLADNVLMDEQGKLVPLKLAHDDLSFGSSCEEGLISVNLAGKYGYINTSGEVAIPLQFANANDFKLGLAAASMDRKKWGYINTKGSFVIPPTIEVENGEALGQFRQLHDGMGGPAIGNKFATIWSKGECWSIDETGTKVFGNRTYLSSCAREDVFQNAPFARVEVEKNVWAAVAWDGHYLTTPRKALELLEPIPADQYRFEKDNTVLIKLKLTDGRNVCVDAKDQEIDEKSCDEHVLGSNGTMGGSIAEDSEMNPIFWGVLLLIAGVLLGSIYGLYRLIRRIFKPKSIKKEGIQ